MADKRFHLVYNSDNNYLMPTMVSAASALYHSVQKENVVIDILDCGIADSVWQYWFERMQKAFPNCGGIIRHTVDKSRISSFTAWRGSVATYARILTPEILKGIDICLFVDGDTLFLSDPLELFNNSNPNYWIQGSVDAKDDGTRASAYEKNGLEVPDCYICCGLMIMNLNALRLNDFVEKCFLFLRQYGNLKSVDQEAINSVCKGHVEKLPREWGVFNSFAFSCVKEPKCIHYVAGKPWLLNTTMGWTHCLYDFERQWFVYAKKLLGITLSDLPGVSYIEYCKRTLATVILRVVRCCRGSASDCVWRKTYFRARI